MKVIITGVTGMVGEGVLLECLQNTKVSEVLIISRKPYELLHPKLKALIVPDFFELNKFSADIQGYDACFSCLMPMQAVRIGERPQDHLESAACSPEWLPCS